MLKKHIVIDARIRNSTTGRPVARLLEHLQDQDTQNTYSILLKPTDSWIPHTKNFNVVVSRFKTFSINPLDQILFSIQLYRLKPDLVYFTLSSQQPIFYLGKQMTFTHDLNLLNHPRPGRLPRLLYWFMLLGYRFLMWHAHKKAKQVIVPTEYVADSVNKKYLFTNRKTTTIYEAAEPALSAKSKTPDNAPVEFIMFTGLAYPHKNLERLISAFGILKEQHPDLTLVLVGKQEYYSKKLQKWTKKHSFAKDIIFTGFIPDEELKWYYQNSRAYVFASLAEGFGLPGLEAMVHGCPVVSSGASCLPEVHGDAAHYFDPYDIQDIAYKIDEVISSEPRRKKMIMLGYENAKRFSWSRFTKETLNIFNKELEN